MSLLIPWTIKNTLPPNNLKLRFRAFMIGVLDLKVMPFQVAFCSISSTLQSHVRLNSSSVLLLKFAPFSNLDVGFSKF